MVEDVVEEFTAGGIFENDTDVSVGLNLIYETYDVGMLDTAKDGDFTVDLGESRRVAANTIPLNKLDSNLWNPS